jgi:hypothetical protein
MNSPYSSRKVDARGYPDEDTLRFVHITRSLQISWFLQKWFLDVCEAPVFD